MTDPATLHVAAQPGELDVVTVGEALALLMARQTGPLEQVTQFDRSTAGAELNVAVGLSRLGHRVGYVSRLGNDSLGRHLLAFMDAQGIDRRCVEIDSTGLRTGLMFKTLQTDGQDPSTEYHRRGSAASRLQPDQQTSAYCAGARWLHLTGISPALSDSVRALVFDLAVQARSAGCRVSFDPNLRPALWSSPADMIGCLNALALQADLVLPGLAEGRLLTGRDTPSGIADFYRDQGVAEVVVKLGVEGAYYAGPDGSGTVLPPRVAAVVDTVGAGDGFAVGVISALLEGLDLRAAALRGNAIGARVVQFPGDNDGLPTRAELGLSPTGKPANVVTANPAERS